MSDAIKKIKERIGITQEVGEAVVLYTALDALNEQAATIKQLEADSEKELLKEIKARDYWEEKATELAELVGKIYNVDVGEHSSGNCPVLKALSIPDEYKLPLEARCKELEKDMAFYKCCALSGEIPKEGSEPSAKKDCTTCKHNGNQMIFKSGCTGCGVEEYKNYKQQD